MWNGSGWAVNYRLRAVDEAETSRRIENPAPVALMYHGILPRKVSAVGVRAVEREGFIRQMRYLKQNFRILHLDDLEQERAAISGNGKRSVVLTFDDGFASNATIVWPILEELKIPAVFFVSTRHLQAGRYLWFAHARALFHLWPGGEVRLLQRSWSLGSRTARERAVRHFMDETRRFPLDTVYRDLSEYPVEDFVPPSVIEEELRGMSESELAAVAQSPLMTVGAHSCNHPYLTQCTAAQAEEEICGAKETLERICGRPVTTFAYPDGDYDQALSAKVKQAGYQMAFAVNRRAECTDSRMAIFRIGIYRAGLGILAAKSYRLITC